MIPDDLETRQLRLEIQEDERRRLARALHDDVGQLLTATKLTLQAAQRARSPRAARGLVNETLTLLEECLQQVRSLALEMRPSLLDDLGLGPALRWYLERQAGRAGFTVKLEDGLADARLPGEIETACYRIVQEAVTNVARHARAKTVTVSLALANDGLETVVHDDGIGFDVAAARSRAAAGFSLGLIGMEERAELTGGRIQVESAPGRGTRLWTHLPIRTERTPTREAGVA